MRDNYKRVKLGDISQIINGGTPSTKEPSYWNGNIPWITPKDLSGYKEVYIEKGERTITEQGLKNSSAQILPKNTILFSSRAPIGYVVIASQEVSTNQGFKNLICDPNLVDYRYLYYWLKKNSSNIAKNAIGSTFAEISKFEMESIEISLPPLSEQKRIANILSSFDNKIEQLKKENNILENIAQSIFKEWFVKYNFPNNDGKPYKDSGGKMIDSELGLIPDGWGVGKLGDYFPVRTGKRNANHARPNGKYKFFTCSQETFLCDEYSFDDGALLLAGNGDFNIKWYKGKFDAYQRTYVLIPYEQENLGYLYFLMKYYLNDIIIGNRGSVISFITKGMIEDFRVSIPEKRIQDDGIRHLEIIRNKIEANKEEILNNYKAKDRLLKYLIT